MVEFTDLFDLNEFGEEFKQKAKVSAPSIPTQPSVLPPHPPATNLAPLLLAEVAEALVV